MTIVYCENCETYHDSDNLTYIQPDIGAFCPKCHSDNLDFMSEKEVLETLNELEGIKNEPR